MIRKIGKIFGLGIGGTALVFFIMSFAMSSEVSYVEKVSTSTTLAKVEPKIKHLSTPEPLKAVYMTQCVAGTPSFRYKVVKLVEETELNSIIIDIKDYTGTVSFKTGNPEIDSLAGPGCKVEDMKDFIEELHDKNIYVIGRVTVFSRPSLYQSSPRAGGQKEK
jgi:hypothetical protein